MAAAPPFSVKCLVSWVASSAAATVKMNSARTTPLTARNAARGSPARPKNAYVREDQILPRLAALAILLAGPAGTPARRSRSRAELTGPADTAALIDQLRADGTVLSYDPDGRTLPPAVTARSRSPLACTLLVLTHARTGKGGPPRESREIEHLPRPEAERG